MGFKKHSFKAKHTLKVTLIDGLEFVFLMKNSSVICLQVPLFFRHHTHFKVRIKMDNSYLCYFAVLIINGLSVHIINIIVFTYTHSF